LGTLPAMLFAAFAIRPSSMSHIATNRSLAAIAGLPLPIPPLPITAMPSFELGDLSARIDGAATMPDASAVRLMKLRRVVFLVIVLRVSFLANFRRSGQTVGLKKVIRLDCSACQAGLQSLVGRRRFPSRTTPVTTRILGLCFMAKQPCQENAYSNANTQLPVPLPFTSKARQVSHPAAILLHRHCCSSSWR